VVQWKVMNDLKEPIAFYVHLINTKNVEKINVFTMTRCEEILCCVLVGSSLVLPVWPPLTPIAIMSS
jgi:hypothetical protein